VPHIQQNATEGDVKNVLKAIENFPNKGSLGILNPEKGSLLDDIVHKYDRRVALELGMSYGCSAIRIACKMTKPESKLLTIQPKRERYAIARSVINYAGLSGKVDVLQTTLGKGMLNDLEDKLKDFLNNVGAQYFDFIYIDHYTHYYLQDFLFLQNKGMVGKGTVIVANTLGYSGVQNYLKYLKDHPEELQTETYKNQSGSASLTMSIYIVD